MIDAAQLLSDLQRQQKKLEADLREQFDALGELKERLGTEYHAARAAGFLMFGQLENGVQCPVSMTYAVVPALRRNAALWERLAPGLLSREYDPRFLPAESKRGRLCRLAAPEDALVSLHADAVLYAGCFEGEEQASLALAAGRKAYVHLVRGALEVNGQSLEAGDALMLADESRIDLRQGRDAEVLVFDLAP